MSTFQRAIVDHIPLIWCEPEQGMTSGELKVAGRKLAIWLPGFSGSKESVEPQLRELAQAGFVALAYDPYQHGERRVESHEEFVGRIIGNIRRHFWPILAHSSEDVSRVIDWAIEELNVEQKVCIGGISMGGDISVAAAGVDARIAVVAACIATPDWLRPGSHEMPGNADRYAWRCYERCNPITNLSRYAHAPAISFQCGANDTQVPPDGAQRFVELLAPLYREYSGHLDICLHENTSHSFTDSMWQNAKRWSVDRA